MFSHAGERAASIIPLKANFPLPTKDDVLEAPTVMLDHLEMKTPVDSTGGEKGGECRVCWSKESQS